MRLSVLCALAFIVSALSLCAEETAVVRAADGFQLPVGPNGTGEGYYIARGYRPNGHLGEDWNGVHGGNTDLGDPVYATANGIVVFARNYHVGWGNVVIIRHAYYEGSDLKYVDSLYGHLLEFTVQEGEQVHRGQQIAKIGDNFGMYEAHLHFEMRKNLQIGMYRSSFPRDFSNYYTPNEFVAAHRVCPKGNHMVSAPINTFAPVAPPILVGPHVETPVFGPPPAGAPARFTKVLPLPPPPSPVVVTSTPAPSFKTPKIVTAVPTPAPEPAPKKSAAGVPVVIVSSTPEPATKHAKTVATAPSPDPTPKKSAKSSEVAAASTATPAPASSTKHGKTSAVTASATPTPLAKHAKTVAATSTPTPVPQKGSDALALIPEPIAAAVSSSSAYKARKFAAPTPEQDSSANRKIATQTVPPEPILPTPTADAAPLRPSGSSYKVDRYGDLRGKPGY